MKLNLGCGKNILGGYINVDRVEDLADVIHNLDEFPYPWGDESVDEVLLHAVLEHLGDLRAVFDELWRILKPRGSIIIHVPHFSHFQALTHHEHKHAFHYNSLNFLTTNAGEKYTTRLFEVEEARLLFHNRILDWFFNRHKYIYTTTFLAYAVPAKDIKFVLRKQLSE